MKKVLMLILCGAMVLGLVVGCDNEKKETKESTKDKQSNVTENNEDNLDNTDSEKGDTKPYKYMVCTGNQDLDKYDSAKEISVEWIGEFDSSQNLVDFNGKYEMSFEKGVSSTIIQKNKKIWEDDYCNSAFYDDDFDKCDVSVVDDKIILNISFDMKHIDSDELSAIKRDRDYLYSLLVTHFDRIDNNQKCIERN